MAVKFPKGSEERKVINAHEGKSVRIWGGQWRKKWTAMEIPSWAQEAKPGQLEQLEKCTRPYGPEGDFHEFCRFTGEELKDQVDLGIRPSTDSIVKMFWAPVEKWGNWHWHGSAPFACGRPQRDLRHLEPNAACSPAPITGAEEQGEGT